MRERPPESIASLLEVRTDAAPSQGSLLEALADVLIDVRERTKSNDEPKENAESDEE